MPAGYELGRDYEVIVYDDASTDATPELLGEYRTRVQTILGDGQGWYAKNNNAMAQRAKGDWLCMLNNDTVLAPGWLEPMLAMGAKHEDIGIVGNIHVFACRQIVNHAGVVLNDQGIPRNLYDGLGVNTPGVCADRRVQAAMAACWLTPRAVFEELGGFDEKYITGCEDVDYCMRIGAANRSVWIAGESMIIHHGGSTPGRYTLDSVNEKRFLDRWADKVTPDWLTIAQREGIDWPRRSSAYRVARSIWRNPIVRSALGPIMRTRAGAQIRQRGVRVLVARGGDHSADDQAGYPSGMSEVVLSSQGHCPSCDTDASFVSKEHWLRDHFVCTNCGSIPRERALMRVIEMYYPNWRELRIHESSPGGRGTSIRLSQECKHYTATHYDTKIPFGSMHPNGHYQSEDLEHQTFADESFDLVISQDVMEHVFDPDQACRDIARTLRPGGAHIFTTPLVNKHHPTQRRAGLKADGSVDYLCEPEYHGNPIDSTGSLVTFHWGYDITEWVFAACGHPTTLVCIDDLSMGIRAEYIEVCMTKKPGAAS